MDLIGSIQIVQALAIGIFTIKKTVDTIRLRMDNHAYQLLFLAIDYKTKENLAYVPHIINIGGRQVQIPKLVIEIANGLTVPKGSDDIRCPDA